MNSYPFGSVTCPGGRRERTQKSVASEVAVGERPYYGSFRRLGDLADISIRADDDDVVDKSWWSWNSWNRLQNNHNNANDDGGGGGGGGGDSLVGGMTLSSSTPSTPSSLRLRMFISSLSAALHADGNDEALRFTTFDTTASDFRYLAGAGAAVSAGGGRDASTLSATPMGSTTKLITAEPSFRFQCCKSKCFPVFGTLFMTISLTVSLGNIYRLPATVFLHGGGSFLVAYAIVALFLGIPLLFLEITLGQFCQQGTTKLWRAVPLFKGVGVVKVISSCILSAYYPIIMSNAALHLFWSLSQPMPTSQCITKSLPRFTHPNSSMAAFGTTLCARNTAVDDAAWFGIQVALLLFVWIVVAMCIFRDSASFRLACCLAIPPALFILITLFTEGVKRNASGLKYLSVVKWDNLLSFDLWYAAIVQFFFSTHVGFGNITTCAGRLYPKSNPFWTSFAFMIINLLVGISFVGVVYMWMGELATKGTDAFPYKYSEMFVLSLIYEVTSSCYGKFGPAWATVAFSLVLLAGFTSTISLIYTIIVGISVETKSKCSWWLLSGIFCFVAFLTSSLCMLQENTSTLRLLDEYVVGKLVVTSTILEVIAFVWVYGLEALANDFEFVLGYKLNFLWKSLWFLAPFLLAMVEFWSWFAPIESHHQLDRDWLYAIGWFIYLLAWVVMIGVAWWQISAQVDYNLKQKFLSSIKPTRNWGPVDPIYRHCWVQWRKQYQATGERDFTLRRRGTRDYTHSVKRGLHAGPVGMRYSVNPSSNQNTLQYKMGNGNDGYGRY